MIAAGLVQNGANVWIFSRTPDDAVAAQLTERGPGTCTSLACDISDREAIDAVVAEVSSAVKSIHLLVNNSGATWGSPFDETPKLSFDKLLSVNLVGLFECSQAFAPLLEAGAEADRPASIVNIASIDGMQVAGIEEYAYTTSKAAVIHLTKQMAGYLARRHITVNTISPGLFPSKMGSKVLEFVAPEVIEKSIPLRRPGEPSDIAGAVLFLAGVAGRYTTGANIVIDGGILVKPNL
jgi:NAD(P)-dependent dehydrogenase (short-subunit alcohol dehydrogenase family)